jgi:hypothetical protein
VFISPDGQGQDQLDISELSDGREEDLFTTVDGRNPAPVDRWIIPLFIGFQSSKVVQNFFHPQ